MSREKARALGRGLDALLPVPSSADGSRSSSAIELGLFRCPIERITPQVGQPRQYFDDDALDELAASLRAHGLLEPLVVRRAAGVTEQYEIIAGERRWRAAQRAGLQDVLVVVKDVSSTEAFELALVENVQREDLNPIEFAEALDRLLHEHGYTHEALAGVLKKDRSTVTNALRLLKLPSPVRAYVMDGRLSEGHARTLLGLSDEKHIEALADQVLRGRLSVRQTEGLVKSARGGSLGTDKRNHEKPTSNAKSPAVRDIETRLSRHLGSKVEVRDVNGHGDILIAYGSLDELDRLLEQLEK